MAADVTRKTVPVTVSVAKNADQGTALTALDTAVNLSIEALLQTPPAGFQPGTVVLGQPNYVFDGSDFWVFQQYTYQTQA